MGRYQPDGLPYELDILLMGITAGRVILWNGYLPITAVYPVGGLLIDRRGILRSGYLTISVG